MKKRESYSKIFALATGLIITLIPTMSEAYTYFPASNPPLLLGTLTPTGIQRAFSSASIDYCTSTSCPTTQHQLSVMIHCDPDGGGHSGSFGDQTGMYVTDGITTIDISVAAPSSPYWTWKNSPSSWPYGQVNGADVVIGNGSSLTNFIIGVIYTYTNSSSNDNTAIDIYNVSNPGGALTVTYSGTSTLSTNSSGGARIDIIADYNHLLSTGKPNCNSFVATWYNVGIGNVGYYATLSSPTSGTSTYLTSSIILAWDICDIAGIQRAQVPKNDNLALFTYMDLGTNQLKYEEWNISTGIVSSPTILDNTFHSPRIDAIDNPALQAVGNNNWLVAAMESSGALIDVYSDSHPSGLGSIPVSGSGGGCPVAVGPGSSKYTIGFWDYTSNAFRTNNVDFSGTFINSVGYNVDNSSSTGFYTDNVTLSGTCNTSGDRIFASWRNVSGPPTLNTFYYKTTGIPFSFKQPSAISKTTQVEMFKVSPNPTINQLTISGTHSNGDSYTIIDMTGKTVMMGEITSDNQTLNVDNLANGMYILDIITSDKTQKVQFVKE